MLPESPPIAYIVWRPSFAAAKSLRLSLIEETLYIFPVHVSNLSTVSKCCWPLSPPIIYTLINKNTMIRSASTKGYIQWRCSINKKQEEQEESMTYPSFNTTDAWFWWATFIVPTFVPKPDKSNQIILIEISNNMSYQSKLLKPVAWNTSTSYPSRSNMLLAHSTATVVLPNIDATINGLLLSIGWGSDNTIPHIAPTVIAQ